MPGRTANASDYRYGFNGKEKENEIAEGDLDFGGRVYDSRLGRWLSRDFKETKYPFYTPYCFAANKPTIAIDPDGKDIIITATDPEFRAKALADLQKLTSVQLVLLVNGHVITAMQAQQFPPDFIEATGTVTETTDKNGNIIEKTAGTEMVTDLLQSPYTTTIVSATEVGTGLNNTMAVMDAGDPEDPNDDSRGSLDAIDMSTVEDPNNLKFFKMFNYGNKGAGAYVFYNPDFMGEPICNADGSTGRPPRIGLGHELIHAVRIVKGVVDQSSTPPNIVDPDSGSKGALTSEELKVRDQEQTIRHEQGVEPRAVPVEENE